MYFILAIAYLPLVCHGFFNGRFGRPSCVSTSNLLDSPRNYPFSRYYYEKYLKRLNSPNITNKNNMKNEEQLRTTTKKRQEKRVVAFKKQVKQKLKMNKNDANNDNANIEHTSNGNNPSDNLTVLAEDRKSTPASLHGSTSLHNSGSKNVHLHKAG